MPPLYKFGLDKVYDNYYLYGYCTVVALYRLYVILSIELGFYILSIILIGFVISAKFTFSKIQPLVPVVNELHNIELERC